MILVFAGFKKSIKPFIPLIFNISINYSGVNLLWVPVPKLVNVLTSLLTNSVCSFAISAIIFIKLFVIVLLTPSCKVLGNAFLKSF